MYRRNNEINYEQVANFLKASVQQVKTQEDVDVLKQFKKVFKKNIPWNLRGYVAAYLLKVATGNARRPFVPRHDFERDGFRRNRDDFSRSRSDERREFSRSENGEGEERRVPHARVEIDPSVAATIFIGIGRNRRVFPRDLLGILINAAGIERDRIGDIRVLANYSFVQLFAEDADKAISALNGYEYRGRPLSVSYSRQRDEDSASENYSSDSYSQGAEIPGEREQSFSAESEDEKAYAAAEKNATGEAFSSPLV